MEVNQIFKDIFDESQSQELPPPMKGEIINSRDDPKPEVASKSP